MLIALSQVNLQPFAYFFGHIHTYYVNAGTTTFSMTHCLSVTVLLPILERMLFQLALISIHLMVPTLLTLWNTDDMEVLTARYVLLTL